MTNDISIIEFAPSKYLKSIRDKMVPELAFSAQNKQEFTKWRGKIKKKLIELLGIDFDERCLLNPQEIERIETENYIREKVVIESNPGCFTPIYVFVPKKGKKPFPAVVAVHGHGWGMRNTAGIWDTEQERQDIEQCNHDYGRQFAEKGYMVFAPDMIGFGLRREEEDKKLGGANHSCRILSFHASIIGKTAIGLRVWDVMRVIDYAETREECNAKKKIGCVGLSGGGTVTLYSTALDERIKCGIVSGYFNTFEDSILAMHHCDCNYIPGIRKYAEMPDVASMIAPRALLIEAGTEDIIFPITAVKSAYDKLKKTYQLLNVEDHLDIDIQEGGHRFYGVKAFDWMNRWLTKQK